jgi:hypothetical protein
MGDRRYGYCVIVERLYVRERARGWVGSIAGLVAVEERVCYGPAGNPNPISRWGACPNHCTDLMYAVISSGYSVYDNCL